jgi:hypothetical protein
MAFLKFLVSRIRLTGQRSNIARMKIPTRHEIDFIKTVQAHIKNLESSSGYNADEPTLRTATGTLRALLPEEMLQRAWQVAGLRGPITVKTYAIAQKGEGAIVYCGGGDLIPNFPTSVCHNANLEERVLNLKDFCRQTRVLVGEEKASTVDLIKYVSNALGATHYDPSGKAARKYDLLRRIEAGEIGRLFISHFNDRNVLHHEILSIAQAVTRSPQVAELMTWKPSGAAA